MRVIWNSQENLVLLLSEYSINHCIPLSRGMDNGLVLSLIINGKKIVNLKHMSAKSFEYLAFFPLVIILIRQQQ